MSMSSRSCQFCGAEMQKLRWVITDTAWGARSVCPTPDCGYRHEASYDADRIPAYMAITTLRKDPQRSLPQVPGSEMPN